MSLAVCAIVLASPTAVVACSGPGLTFERVAGQSELIVEGRVTDVLLDGLAYQMDVDEVFKGSVEGKTVRIGPVEASGSRGCELGLRQGDHVILGVVDIDGRQSALGTGVWFIGADGSLSSPGNLWTEAADADALRERLRAALPDTAYTDAIATSDQPGSAPIVALGGLFLVAAGIVASKSPLRFTPHRRRRVWKASDES